MPSASSKPFPYMAIVALCMSLTCDCYVQLSLLPYVGYMILYLGVTDDKDEVGYYAGYLASSLLLGRFISSFFLGHWSDQHGRKPVLYISLTSIVIFSTLFGLSTSLWCALLCRFLMGLLNSILATTRVTVSEVCGKKHEVKGMGVITGCWSIGFVIGSAAGGLLADPCSQYPTLFGEFELLQRYPYLLPNLGNSLLASISLLFVAVFVPETLGKLSLSREELNEDSKLLSEVESGVNNKANSDNYKAVNDESDDKRAPLKKDFKRDVQHFGPEKESAVPYLQRSTESVHANQHVEERVKKRDSVNSGSMWGTVRSLFSDPVIQKIFAIYFLLSFVNVVFDEVFPVWAMSTTELGGLDWRSSTIGQVLCFTGVMMAAFQFILYPIIAKSIGYVCMLNIFSALVVPFYVIITFASQIAGGSVTIRAVVVVLLSSNKIINNLLFTSVILMINHAVPKELCGTINSISVMILSVAKGTGPPVGASIFAYSLSDDSPAIFDYRTTFILCSGISAAFSYLSWKYFHHSKYLSANEPDETTTR